MGEDDAKLLVRGRMEAVEGLLERCLINCRQIHHAAGEQTSVHPELLVDLAGVLLDRLREAALAVDNAMDDIEALADQKLSAGSWPTASVRYRLADIKAYIEDAAQESE